MNRGQGGVDSLAKGGSVMHGWQLNLEGKDLIEVAIDRLRMFEPPEGYYLAFSGGKDSITIKKLAELAGVKHECHHNLTTADPPELVRYIKRVHPDVQIHRPELTMWQLIPKKLMPPTRLARYCCEYLKERGGEGRFVITGVRWAESAKRKLNRHELEIVSKSKAKKFIRERELFLMSDNDEKRKMIDQCFTKKTMTLNPIIDWLDQDVWAFIKKYNLPYCELYDEGYARLGCIGCPNSRAKGRERDFKRWPKYYEAYIRTFGRMLIVRQQSGLETTWKTTEEVMHWWIYGG